MYRPVSFVVVVREVLVATSVSVTVAPDTTAPDWSVTVPATVPVAVDCAHIGRVPTQSTTRRNRASFMLRMCNGSSVEFRKPKISRMQLVNKGWTAVNGGSSLPTGWCLGQHLIAIGRIRSDQAILTSCTRRNIVYSTCLTVKLNPRLSLLPHPELLAGIKPHML